MLVPKAFQSAASSWHVVKTTDVASSKILANRLVAFLFIFYDGLDGWLDQFPAGVKLADERVRFHDFCVEAGGCGWRSRLVSAEGWYPIYCPVWRGLCG